MQFKTEPMSMRLWGKWDEKCTATFRRKTKIPPRRGTERRWFRRVLIKWGKDAFTSPRIVRFRFEFINVDAVIIYSSASFSSLRNLWLHWQTSFHRLWTMQIKLQRDFIVLSLFALHDTQLAVQTFEDHSCLVSDLTVETVLLCN